MQRPTLSPKKDIFLQKDEIANMMLDNVFGTVDEQIDLAASAVV